MVNLIDFKIEPLTSSLSQGLNRPYLYLKMNLAALAASKKKCHLEEIEKGEREGDRDTIM